MLKKPKLSKKTSNQPSPSNGNWKVNLVISGEKIVNECSLPADAIEFCGAGQIAIKVSSKCESHAAQRTV
jgi:hypothetical protein